MENDCFDRNKYFIIRKCLEPETIKFITLQFELFEQYIYNEININEKLSACDNQVEKSFSVYCPHFAETLLIFLKEKIEKSINKKLLPSYSYGRIYYKNAELKKHIDREECEITATICLRNDKKPWDIWFKNNNNTDTVITLEEGDMVLFYGKIMEHWRYKFEGEKQFQCFLHYVEKDGKYKNNIYDKRKYLFQDGNKVVISEKPEKKIEDNIIFLKTQK
jgi:hypothetical protein